MATGRTDGFPSFYTEQDCFCSAQPLLRPASRGMMPVAHAEDLARQTFWYGTICGCLSGGLVVGLGCWWLWG